MIRRTFARFTIALTAAVMFAPFASLVAQGQSVPAVGGNAEAVREDTLRVLSFGLGAPLPGPAVDDLYGRDAVFFADAVNRAASAWSKVETTAISGLDCTPERLRSELERLEKAAAASDFVIVHASTHGTTENKLPRLDSNRLSGRWGAIDSTEPSSRWEGRIVDSRRIDGQAPGVAWEFRR